MRAFATPTCDYDIFLEGKSLSQVRGLPHYRGYEIKNPPQGRVLDFILVDMTMTTWKQIKEELLAFWKLGELVRG